MKIKLDKLKHDVNWSDPDLIRSMVIKEVNVNWWRYIRACFYLAASMGELSLASISLSMTSVYTDEMLRAKPEYSLL